MKNQSDDYIKQIAEMITDDPDIFVTINELNSLTGMKPSKRKKMAKKLKKDVIEIELDKLFKTYAFYDENLE